VHRYVTGRSDDGDAVTALSDFRRFPAWMWRNETMRDFLGWLADFNATRAADARTGVFGLDLYSLHASIESVLAFSTASTQRPPHARGSATRASNTSATIHTMLPPASGAGDPLDVFWAEQNARLVVSAERYYRAMYRGRESTWNLRDRHMIDTLAALRERIPGTADGIVVWAHNSHLGDARATEMSDRGEVNVGQLVRERYRPDVFSIGFSTFDGTVTAASDRDAPAERKRVRPGLAESYERMFHEHAEDRFWLDLGDRDVAAALRGTLLQRAIGVIYRPETERWSHYFEARLPEQFDAIIHLDNNVAVTPLDRTAGWDEGEPPETWPTSL